MLLYLPILYILGYVVLFSKTLRNRAASAWHYAYGIAPFVGVAISLQCNEDKSYIVKVSSAMFAFMFGFLYILVNYFMYRVNFKSNACLICFDNPFPF